MRDLSRLLSDELESFYWMGFVLADGWVTTNDYNGRTLNVFGVMLSEEDGEHLRRLGDYIGVGVLHYERDTNFLKGAKSCLLKVQDSVNVPKLKEKFDIHNSKTLHPPSWRSYCFSDDQLMALFIGYVDGDGSINRRIGSDRLHLSIQTKAEWFQNIEFMLEALQRLTGVLVSSKPNVNCRGHLHLSLCKNSMIGKMKKFALDNKLPIMSRKWDMVTEDLLTERKNGTKIVTFRHPTGALYTSYSIRKFAIDAGLPYNTVLKLASGTIKQYKGWTVHE